MEREARLIEMSKRGSSSLLAGSTLLHSNDTFRAHSGENGDNHILPIIEHLAELGSKLRIGGELEVVLGAPIGGHKAQVCIISDVEKSVIGSLDVGDIHVVGGGTDFFILLSSEEVDSNEMDLGVSVLPGLGSAHIHDLAGEPLDDHMTVLAEGGALHRV